jgi:hypothetical protein
MLESEIESQARPIYENARVLESRGRKGPYGPASLERVTYLTRAISAIESGLRFFPTSRIDPRTWLRITCAYPRVVMAGSGRAGGEMSVSADPAAVSRSAFADVGGSSESRVRYVRPF